MKRYNQRWAQDDSDVMERMLAEGQSHKQIAIALDRTPWAVSSRIQWLAGKGKPHKAARAERARIVAWLKNHDGFGAPWFGQAIENGEHLK